MNEPSTATEAMIVHNSQRRVDAVKAKIEALQQGGHTVTIDTVIWGLLRVDDGPELTVNQFLSLSLPPRGLA